MADDGQVVGDDDVGEAELALQPRQQVQDLALHGDVETGGRLVRDDELGRECQRAGDADAAGLAAGKLMRIAAGEIRGQADESQQPARLGVETLALDPVNGERFGDQRLHREPRAQAGHWILEHHGHLAAIAGNRSPALEQRLPAVEANAAGLHRHEADDGAAERALARTALADEGEGGAGGDGEGHVEHGIEEAVFHADQARLDRPQQREADVEIADLEERAHAVARWQRADWVPPMG